MKSQTDLLKRTIESLPFSHDFKSFATAKHYLTLNDVLQLKVYQLIETPGFNYHMLNELAKFLQEAKLLEQLKED